MKIKKTNFTKQLALMGAIASLALPLPAMEHGAANPDKHGKDHHQMKSDKADESALATVRARNLVGYDVYGEDGEKIGDIIDFAFEASDQSRLHYVLINTNGFLGIGGEDRAVSADALWYNKEMDRYEIALTTDAFTRFPVIESRSVEYLTSESYLDNLEANALAAPDQHPSNSDRLILNSDLDHVSFISTSSGDELGYGVDILVNVESGLVPYIIIRARATPFRGAPQDYAVPTHTVTKVADNEVHVTVTEDKLIGAPYPENKRAINEKETERGTVYKLKPLASN